MSGPGAELPEWLTAGGRCQQPDRVSCGATVLVVARMLADPALSAPLTRSREAFAAEVRRTHRELTGVLDGVGLAQIPWPRALGTPPWSLGRALTGVRRLVPARWGSDSLWESTRASLEVGAVVPWYVGSRRLPRHVVLVVAADGDSVQVFEPGTGRVNRVADRDVAGQRMRGAGWPVCWFGLPLAQSARAA
ncbi:hypothetical protein [Nocardioides limicola]|uniref:hypothetical protein n=1 Tax=Nocardioides limicola TaxID=2803368 RepID=UPI00193C6538|nr:hypothetical protein [Nocardioides sp. DJM-14]